MAAISGWPSEASIIGFCAICFSLMLPHAQGGRQPYISVSMTPDRRLLPAPIIAPSVPSLPYTPHHYYCGLPCSPPYPSLRPILPPQSLPPGAGAPSPPLTPTRSLAHAHHLATGARPPAPASALDPPGNLPFVAPTPPAASPLSRPAASPVTSTPLAPPVPTTTIPVPAPSPAGPSPSPLVAPAIGPTPEVLVPPSPQAPALAPASFSNTTAPSPMAMAPSRGCCTANMMARPGSKASDCQCVYPIEINFRMGNASSAFTNLTSQFQHELASQLALTDVQVQIQAFQFGSNFSLNMVVDIGPLSGISFSLEQIQNINNSLTTHSVHFSSILFADYTVVTIMAFLPASPPTAGSAPRPSNSPSPSQTGKPTADGPLPPSNGHRRRMIKVTIGVVVGCTGFLLIVACIIWKFISMRRRDVKNPESASKAVSAVPTLQESSSHRMITTREISLPRPANTRDFFYEELQEATNDFSSQNFIGEGGFGKVYRGVLKDGTDVAIKKLTSGGNQGDKEFLVEVEMLSRLHHRHLVKLLGFYCSLEPLQQLLCYELVPNGSLESWLHGPLSQSRGPLDWNTRMKIALGAARGLAYLHEDSQPCVIHRDFKASNILLEYNFNPKVADFGLARSAPEGQQEHVSTRVMGTFGYVAPEYAMTGHLLVKSDVYSYGVVLLELLSGRKPVDYTQPAREENIVAWARPVINERTKLHELADPRLGSKFPADDFLQMATIAAACVAPEWSQRPTMGEVVQNLKLISRNHEYGSSRDAERGMSSEGEREGPVDTPTSATSASASTSSFPTTMHMHKPTLTTFGSDGSSSIFSSGPFSGLIGIDNDSLSKTTVISEDLDEGR